VFQLRHAGLHKSALLATPPQPVVPRELDPANKPGSPETDPKDPTKAAE
jgi:hypothetical protein